MGVRLTVWAANRYKQTHKYTHTHTNKQTNKQTRLFYIYRCIPLSPLSFSSSSCRSFHLLNHVFRLSFFASLIIRTVLVFFPYFTIIILFIILFLFSFLTLPLFICPGPCFHLTCKISPLSSSLFSALVVVFFFVLFMSLFHPRVLVLSPSSCFLSHLYILISSRPSLSHFFHIFLFVFFTFLI